MLGHSEEQDTTSDDDPAQDETLTFSQIWRDWELNLASLALLGFILILSGQVISRYVFNEPISWVEEVAMMMLIWMTFIAAAWLVRKDQHIRVEFLDELGVPKLRKLLYTLYDIISIVFLVLLAISGYQLIGEMEYSKTPALQIPYSYIVSIVPITAVLMAIYFSIIVLRRFRPAEKRGGTTGAE